MIVAKKLTVCLYAGAAPEKLSCMYSSQSLVTTACDGVTVITSTRGDTLSNPSYMASYNTHIWTQSRQIPRNNMGIAYGIPVVDVQT